MRHGAIHRHRQKTAEERLYMLARGWLAYPVTPIHAHLPPKSGCICHHSVTNRLFANIIFLDLYNRPSAVASATEPLSLKNLTLAVAFVFKRRST